MSAVAPIRPPSSSLITRFNAPLPPERLMTALPTYFTDFLRAIRLDDELTQELQEAHRELTERLEADPGLKPIFIDTFLQGSYKRATIVDPGAEDLADVDVVVVTGLSEQVHPDPGAAMDLFVPFLDRNYKHLWESQDRSFGIKQGRVWLDMVITSAPSEAMKNVLAYRSVRTRGTIEEDREFRIRKAWTEPEKRGAPHTHQLLLEAEGQPLGGWSEDPLRIPDRSRRCWEPTHPLAQIDWTADKNRRTNGHYIHVVRALKWWRQRQPLPKYPKGYPLESLVGDACPDGILTVAEGVVKTLETLEDRWRETAADRQPPYVKDHGVDQNVLARISGEEFSKFYALLGPALDTARLALETEDKVQSVLLWQQLFGGRFPDAKGTGGPDGDGPKGGPDGGGGSGGFSRRREVGTVGGGRFG